MEVWNEEGGFSNSLGRSSGQSSTRAFDSDMLLLAAAAASCSLRHLLSPLRTNGGAGAPPRTGAAKSRALTTPLQRSFSFTFGCACSSASTPGDKDPGRDLFDEYSVLSADIPWETEDIWRTFAGYLLILHIPLSFGGLDAVAKVLHCSSLDPLTTVVSTTMLQLGELTLGLALLQYTAKPHHQVGTFFSPKFSSRRSWIKESVLWFGLLMSMVFITSLIADRLIGPEDAYNPILKEILSDCPTSRLVCFFLYSDCSIVGRNHLPWVSSNSPVFLDEMEERCHHKLTYVQCSTPLREKFPSIVRHRMHHRVSLSLDWNFGCFIHHPQLV